MTARDPLTAAAEEAMTDRGDRDAEAAWEASTGAIDGRPDAYEMRDEWTPEDWREEQHRGWGNDR